MASGAEPLVYVRIKFCFSVETKGSRTRAVSDS
jgi:hypothetical protein